MGGAERASPLHVVDGFQSGLGMVGVDAAHLLAVGLRPPSLVEVGAVHQPRDWGVVGQREDVLDGVQVAGVGSRDEAGPVRNRGGGVQEDGASPGQGHLLVVDPVSDGGVGRPVDALDLDPGGPQRGDHGRPCEVRSSALPGALGCSFCRVLLVVGIGRSWRRVGCGVGCRGVGIVLYGGTAAGVAALLVVLVSAESEGEPDGVFLGFPQEPLGQPNGCVGERPRKSLGESGRSLDGLLVGVDDGRQDRAVGSRFLLRARPTALELGEGTVSLEACVDVVGENVDELLVKFRLPGCGLWQAFADVRSGNERVARNGGGAGGLVGLCRAHLGGICGFLLLVGVRRGTCEGALPRPFVFGGRGDARGQERGVLGEGAQVRQRNGRPVPLTFKVAGQLDCRSGKVTAALGDILRWVDEGVAAAADRPLPQFFDGLPHSLAIGPGAQAGGEQFLACGGLPQPPQAAEHLVEVVGGFPLGGVGLPVGDGDVAVPGEFGRVGDGLDGALEALEGEGEVADPVVPVAEVRAGRKRPGPGRTGGLKALAFQGGADCGVGIAVADTSNRAGAVVVLDHDNARDRGRRGRRVGAGIRCGNGDGCRCLDAVAVGEACRDHCRRGGVLRGGSDAGRVAVGQADQVRENLVIVALTVAGLRQAQGNRVGGVGEVRALADKVVEGAIGDGRPEDLVSGLAQPFVGAGGGGSACGRVVGAAGEAHRGRGALPGLQYDRQIACSLLEGSIRAVGVGVRCGKLVGGKAALMVVGAPGHVTEDVAASRLVGVGCGFEGEARHLEPLGDRPAEESVRGLPEVPHAGAQPLGGRTAVGGVDVGPAVVGLEDDGAGEVQVPAVRVGGRPLLQRVGACLNGQGLGVEVGCVEEQFVEVAGGVQSGKVAVGALGQLPRRVDGCRDVGVGEVVCSLGETVVGGEDVVGVVLVAGGGRVDRRYGVDQCRVGLGFGVAGMGECDGGPEFVGGRTD